MDTSNSALNGLSSIDLVTGEYRKHIPALTAEEYAELIFRAINLLNSRLKYLHGFALLGRTDYELELRQQIERAQLGSAFGLIGRVRRLCSVELYGQKKGLYSVFLTQEGDLRLVFDPLRTDTDFSTEGITVQRVTRPAALVEFLSHDVNFARAVWLFNDAAERVPSIGVWVLGGLEKAVRTTEEALGRHYRSMHETLVVLTSWRETAAASVLLYKG